MANNIKTFKAEQKYVLISPRKVRPVVEVVKKETPLRSLELLPFVEKRGAEFLLKVIKSAITNAESSGVSANNLSFKEIIIGEGPRLKRGTPVSRGRWHPIKKRMSHIKVILMERKSEAVNKDNLNIKEKEVKTEKKGKTNGTKS